jgi:hypothetical protein
VTGHHISVTTHTPELAQVRELNAALRAPDATSVTVGEIGLTGQRSDGRRGTPSGPLPAGLVLSALTSEGPPDFPYIHGHFGPAGAERTVTLHTEALRRLSAHFGLRHRWGTDD